MEVIDASPGLTTLLPELSLLELEELSQADSARAVKVSSSNARET